MSEYKLDIKPVIPDRWGDLETLFGPRGASAGCWCMWFRLKHSQFEAQKGEENKKGEKVEISEENKMSLLRRGWYRIRTFFGKFWYLRLDY